MPVPFPAVCICFHATRAELSSVTETVWPTELKILLILLFTEKVYHSTLKSCVLTKNFTVRGERGSGGEGVGRKK